MDNSKSVLWATGAVLACLASAVFGYTTRTAVDMGSSVSKTKPGLIASIEPEATISESQYFYEVSQLLRAQYVEPVEIDEKMASGAVRGMINSLLDPDTIYLNKEQFAAYERSQKGVFEGIGVEITYKFNEEELDKIRNDDANADALMLLPEVIVSTVIPGSPAEKAGLRPGDAIEMVNGKNVVTHKDIAAVRELQNQVTEGETPPAELNRLRDELDKKIKNNLATNKAREHLVVGDTGTVEVGWTHNGTSQQAQIEKQKIQIAPLEKDGNVYSVRFVEGLGKALADAKLQNGDTLDLRHSPLGNPKVLLEALEAVAPADTYGYIISQRPNSPRTVKTTTGRDKTVNLTLLVDESTRGVAEIFARALSAKGLADLEGTLPADQPKWVENEQLPDGTGYTLMTGYYSPTKTLTAEAAR